MTTTEVQIPRTFRALFAAVEEVGGTVTAQGERCFDIQVPRKFRECNTGRRFTAPTRIGYLGWYVRDGKNHLSGPIADVQRAVENIREGKDPLKPRRELDGLYTGRDASGRFAVGSQG